MTPPREEMHARWEKLREGMRREHLKGLLAFSNQIKPVRVSVTTPTVPVMNRGAGQATPICNWPSSPVTSGVVCPVLGIGATARSPVCSPQALPFKPQKVFPATTSSLVAPLALSTAGAMAII